MEFKQWGLIILLSVNAFVAYACSHYEQVQMPMCLAKQMSSSGQILAENKEFRISEFCSSELNQLALLAHKVHCGRFINRSHLFLHDATLEQKQEKAKQLLSAPRQWLRGHEYYSIRHQKEVSALLNDISPDNMWQTVIHLTSFYNRSARQDSGLAAVQWLKTRFEMMATTYGRRDTETFFVPTAWYKQPSLVTVIGKDIKEPAVVIGAHIDTLDDYMPGADDDASGSASILEATRVLLSSKLALKRPIYIIWYAAEERGLVGSQQVVTHFLDQGIPVKAVLQLDMTGYRTHPMDPDMWVFLDYTDLDLSHFLVALISTYIQVPVHFSYCGYGCSDHASWDAVGIPAAFPCETSFEAHNPLIHTAGDSMDLLNLEHISNFSKLALAFAVEMALSI